MTKRITIVLSDETNKKIRKVQADLIPTVDYNVSFSSVVEMLLKEALKKWKKDEIKEPSTMI